MARVTLTVDIPVEFALVGDRMTLAPGTPEVRPCEKGIPHTPPTRGATVLQDDYGDPARVGTGASEGLVFLTLSDFAATVRHAYTPEQARALAIALVSHASTIEEATA